MAVRGCEVEQAEDLGEGLARPYVAGTSNPGPALLYVLVFVALIVFDRLEGRTPYSIDYYFAERWPRWACLAEWAAPLVGTGSRHRREFGRASLSLRKPREHREHAIGDS